MDSKFAMALHLLIFISESQTVASSQDLATSVGTNASHIRKLVGMLKQAELIQSQQGRAGFTLVKDKSEIALSEIYQAVYPEKALFKVHKDPNPTCPIGQHIEQVLSPTFTRIEEQLLANLEHESLADVIAKLYQTAKKA